MARTLTAGTEGELIKSVVSPVFFMEFQFDTVIRFWTGLGDQAFGGQTFSGAGDVVKLSPLQETIGVEAVGVAFEIQGVTTELISLALSEPVQGKSVGVWIGFLDGSDALIADPMGPFMYIMDTIHISENPDNPRITLTAESALSLLEIPRPRRYTHEDQQIEFSGDNGLIFVPSIQEKQITWGKGVS